MEQRHLIDKVPDEFPGSDGDSYLLEKLDPGIRYLAEKNIQQDKKIQWGCETARQAYNLGVELERSLEKMRQREDRLRSAPMRILMYLLQSAIPALLGAAAVKLFG